MYVSLTNKQFDLLMKPEFTLKYSINTFSKSQ